MMAAYQPQPAMHPGMAPHGHPAMTPGGQPMPQQMPQQMQQMGHPSVSGPAQPHVTQAGAMMGMQPGQMGGQPPGAGMAGGQMGGVPGQMGAQSMAGGMPNAHAMNHLNPQAHMQQQQQMMQQHLAQNPQLAMARQQQIMQQRAMQAQIQASGGMPQGMQQAMQGMNPQQLQQMQQNNPGMHPGQVQLPAHLMQQQQQLLLQRQAQAHAQQQNHLQQQQMAMQQQGSQHSNPGGQPGPPNQQGAQGQQPGQMRPQSRMANPNEQVQTPGQTAPQGQQGQQGQPQGQQSQAGGQPQNPQQPAQQPQMTQQQQQQQQQQLMLQQRQRMMHLQQQQQQQQQQNAMARQSMSQPQVNINGQAILFFLNMCDYLCQFGRHNGRDIDLWRMFVDKHFAPDAELTHAFTFGNEGQSKEFRVLRPSIARYFHQYFASGAESIRIHTEYVKEERIPPHNRLRMTSGSATLRVMYENGARLEMRGSITADFGTGMIPEAIENLTFWTSASEEVIERSEIARLLSTFSPTMSTKASPKMSKKNPPKGQQKGSQYDGLTIDHFPKARKGTWGGPEQVQTFLELGETFNVMADLMAFAQEKKLRPDSALESINQQYAKEGPPGAGDPNQQAGQGNPQLNLPPNGVPMANRTSSMQSMNNPQFNSPAMPNLNLPMQPNGIPMNGSPHISNTPGLQPGGMQVGHTPSPGHQNMQAPAMLPQHSQQGTNSSAASANTSPNVNNKRRRSTVKTEDDGGGPMKPSPTVRKKGKPGA